LADARYVLNLGFSRRLDDPAMHTAGYALAFLKGDANAMEHEMEWAVGKAGGEDAMLALQADTEAYAGHLQKARELSRQAVQAAQAANLAEPAAIWQGTAALRDAVYGKTQEAHAEAEKVMDIAPNSRDARTLAILVFARTGDLRRAKAMLVGSVGNSGASPRQGGGRFHKRGAQLLPAVLRSLEDSGGGPSDP